MNFYKKTQKLMIEEYPSGVILPSKEVADGPMWGLGGVCSADGSFADSSFYDGGWARHGGRYDWTDEDYLDQDVVYIGPFFPHWGHLLVDLSTRWWGVSYIAENRKNDFRVAYLGDEEPAGNYLRILELLGIRAEQLIHIQKPTRFRKVYLPQQAFKSCEWYTEEHISMLDTIVFHALEALKERNEEIAQVENLRKVYFSRRRFAKALSSEFGEAYFEDFFCYNGYQPVAPETLTVEQQIYVWNYAEEIICMNGTIPLNAVFCKNSDLKVTILNKMSIFHENPFIIYAMRSVEADYIDIYKEPLKNYPKSLGEGPYLLWAGDCFEQAAGRRNWSGNPTSDKNKKNYFFRQQLSYLWCVLGLKRKLRAMLSKAVPESLKAWRRRVMGIQA